VGELEPVFLDEVDGVATDDATSGDGEDLNGDTGVELREVLVVCDLAVTCLLDGVVVGAG